MNGTELLARPRIKLTLSPLDRVLVGASIVLLIMIWTLALYVLLKMPAIIPTHFNAVAMPDGYGSKKYLYVFPAIATTLFISISWLCRYPHKLLYATPITSGNAMRQYKLATEMLRVLNMAVLVVFTGIMLFTCLATAKANNELSAWILPTAMIVLFAPAVILIIRSARST